MHQNVLFFGLGLISFYFQDLEFTIIQTNSSAMKANGKMERKMVSDKGYSGNIQNLFQFVK